MSDEFPQNVVPAPAVAPPATVGANATPLSNEASALRMATFRLARRLRAQRAVEMSDGQFAVLAVLRTFGPQSLGELAERERVTSPSMNRTVNGLEELGFLSRTADEADRRRVIIALTAEGDAVVDETVRRRDAWLENALTDLDLEQREVLKTAAAIMQGLASR